MAPTAAGSDGARPSLGNRAALGLFALLLLAYVVQTQAAEYVQSDLDYRQPFFLFFLTHAAFLVVLPLHLLLLRLQTGTPITANVHALHRALLATHSPSPSDVRESRHAYIRFAPLIVCLTLGVSAPSLLWYMAVSLTSISSVTALFNTNAFWTYLLSLLLLRDPFRPVRLAAVLLASVGVVVDAYAGACSAPAPPADGNGPLGEKLPPSSPLLGNLLAFAASLASSLFQVLYKKYATSPSPSTSAGASPPSAGAGAGAGYAPIPSSPASGPARIEQAVEDGEPLPLPLPASAPQLPFALYANMITTLLGLGTLAIMWVPIPVLSANGLEPFRLPADGKTALLIAVIATCGVIFNTTFMILLGVWGPIVTSVGSLLTTLLVLIVDVVLGGCVTLGSWVGCTLIAVAFAVLAVDVARE
ncbi:hypothetical protein CALCODRAFT_57809 [Calocera cornea HHB12733]|uniref:EamA domain-containing protein n=1 Tax=Calocera cornea HHB12733 TaxID=1353952 RepID=A0A165IVA4_9BASI|nr:hypothetical protein CALCODRAFT_57809 [Calocera cornea HHB12733]